MDIELCGRKEEECQEQSLCVLSKLNKVCPKDSFSLPHMDLIRNSTIRHEMLSFINTLLECNQTRMNLDNEEK